MKNQSRKTILPIFMCLLFPLMSFAQGLDFGGIEEVNALKRGKEYNIRWTGGANDQLIKIELHDRTGKVQNWDGLENDGQQVIKLYGKLRPGKNYVFKIIGEDGEMVSSQNVAIKRRVPLLLQVASIAVVPIVLLLAGDGGDVILNAPEPPLPK